MQLFTRQFITTLNDHKQKFKKKTGQAFWRNLPLSITYVCKLIFSLCLIKMEMFLNCYSTTWRCKNYWYIAFQNWIERTLGSYHPLQHTCIKRLLFLSRLKHEPLLIQTCCFLYSMSGSATGLRQQAELQQRPSLRCLVMDKEMVMSVGDLFLVDSQYLSVSFSALTLLVRCMKAIRPIKIRATYPNKGSFFRSSEGRRSKGKLATTGPPGKWLLKQKWWPGFYAPHGLRSLPTGVSTWNFVDWWREIFNVQESFPISQKTASKHWDTNTQCSANRSSAARRNVATGSKQHDRQTTRLRRLTFLTNPGDHFTQPMNISRVAVANSVADAGLCKATRTATGGISVHNNAHIHMSYSFSHATQRMKYTLFYKGDCTAFFTRQVKKVCNM